MRLGFSKLLGSLSYGKNTYLPIKDALKSSEKDLFDDDYAIFL